MRDTEPTTAVAALHVEESGRGDPLLLMPGFTEGIEDLGEIREELAKHYRVVGDRDAGNPADTVRALAKLIPSAELIVVEGAGHPVHRQRPDWFVPTVTGWLAAH